MSASLYVTPYNGTTGDADAGYSTGVTDLNQFYEVRPEKKRSCVLVGEEFGEKERIALKDVYYRVVISPGS